MSLSRSGTHDELEEIQEVEENPRIYGQRHRRNVQEANKEKHALNGNGTRKDRLKILNRLPVVPEVPEFDDEGNIRPSSLPDAWEAGALGLPGPIPLKSALDPERHADGKLPRSPAANSKRPAVPVPVYASTSSSSEALRACMCQGPTRYLG